MASFFCIDAEKVKSFLFGPNAFYRNEGQYLDVAMAAFILVAFVLVWALLMKRWQSKQVYLLDYACFNPPELWRVSYATLLEHSALNGMSESNREFQKKIIQHSGLSQLTTIP